ncbi:ArgS-related anticodon-binding protein NrtL [Streptomyces sp. NPDC093252]|uniref:ArgS-related anticodon-binding protein NrtL n=1 Tax=Streptomyces sp. NPDC093252 TaxID=3154980 RepID=UPI00341EE6A2
MTPVELSRTVLRAVRSAVDRGELRVQVPARAVVTVPGAGGCGDYATNIALQLARPAGHPPRRVAEILSPHLLKAPGVREVVVTGPGFLNLTVEPGAGGSEDSPIAELVRDVLRDGLPYGHVAPRGDTVTVRLRAAREPRALVVRDAVARILRSQGEVVEVSVVEAGEGAPPPPERAQPADPRHHTPSAPTLPAIPTHLIHPHPSPHPTSTPWPLLHPAPHDKPHPPADSLVQRESNPLFRVRYAHARARALRRNAADLGFRAEAGDIGSTLRAPSAPLLTALSDHPRILAAAAVHRDPSRLARQLVAVADAVAVVRPEVLPRGDEKPLAVHRARLALVEAAGAVLADGLSLLGIDAPDHL